MPRPSARGRANQLRRRLRGDPGWRRTTQLTARSLRTYLELVARHRTTPNGVFSARVLDLHLPVLLRTGLDLDLWGPPPTFVYLERSDRVAQAVSWVRAMQDGAWSSYTSRPGTPDLAYDEAAIERRLAAIEAGERRWTEYFAAQSITTR